jgi:hypothetical protein
MLDNSRLLIQSSDRTSTYPKKSLATSHQSASRCPGEIAVEAFVGVNHKKVPKTGRIVSVQVALLLLLLLLQARLRIQFAEGNKKTASHSVHRFEREAV